jgi:glycine oxidase
MGDGRGADRVVVVGAGLIGVALACELARRGFFVLVLEKSIAGAVSTGASSAAAGILGPQLEHDDDGPTLALGLDGARATRRLLEVMGADVDAFTSAAVKVAFDDDGARGLARRAGWQASRGLRVELVDGDEARARVPSLSFDIVRAAFFPDDHCIDPRAYLRALRVLARTRRVDVRVGSPLAELVVERGRCVGVRLDSGEIERADAVVLCAGAWSAIAPGVDRLLGLTLEDVHPVKGQIVELYAPGVVDRVIYGDSYLVPRGDGRVVCGSTMERTGFDSAVTADGTAKILAGARRTVPALIDAEVRSTWAGLRPATRDGLPLIGESALRGLWLSTGHFRNGVLLAALSAEIIAALLMGEPVAIDVLPFRPERLGSRR